MDRRADDALEDREPVVQRRVADIPRVGSFANDAELRPLLLGLLGLIEPEVLDSAIDRWRLVSELLGQDEPGDLESTLRIEMGTDLRQQVSGAIQSCG